MLGQALVVVLRQTVESIPSIGLRGVLLFLQAVVGENSLDNSVGKVMLCLGGSQSGDSIWDGQAISPHEGHILTGEIF